MGGRWWSVVSRGGQWRCSGVKFVAVTTGGGSGDMSLGDQVVEVYVGRWLRG